MFAGTSAAPPITASARNESPNKGWLFSGKPIAESPVHAISRELNTSTDDAGILAAAKAESLSNRRRRLG